MKMMKKKRSWTKQEVVKTTSPKIKKIKVFYN